MHARIHGGAGILQIYFERGVNSCLRMVHAEGAQFSRKSIAQESVQLIASLVDVLASSLLVFPTHRL
jgi:hypothetical protein